MKWSDAEKKLAHRVFMGALETELAEVIADFKQRAASAQVPDDLWEIAEHLQARRRDIDQKYDYRYSQLIFIFGCLVREGRVQEAQLAGLSDKKLDQIRRTASF
jgi:hypothetical protein